MNCLTNGHLVTQNQLSLSTVNSATPANERYAVTQPNKFTSYLDYLEQQTQADLQIDEDSEKSQDEEKSQDKVKLPAKENKDGDQKTVIGTGLNEFTDEIDETIFDGIPCSQLQVSAPAERLLKRVETAEPMNCQSSGLLELSFNAQPSNIHERHSKKQVASLSSGTHANSGKSDFNPTSLSFDIFNSLAKPMANIATQNRKMFNDKFDAITSSSNNQFFSNVTERVIRKPKKDGDRRSDGKSNETSAEDDEFNFKTSLSSQIPFDKFQF